MEKKIFFLFIILFIYMSALKSCILIVNNNDSDNIRPALKEYLTSRKIEYLVVDRNSDLNAIILKNKFKGIILTGGPLLYSQKDINLEDVNPNLVALLNLDCPILGICFGHQTLAKVFGGEVSKMPKLIKGLEEIKIINNVAIFKGMPNKFNMEQNHSDSVSKVPDCFEIMASSKTCAFEGIKHKTKPIFGFQFHPELSGELGYKLLDNFIELCYRST